MGSCWCPQTEHFSGLAVCVVCSLGQALVSGAWAPSGAWGLLRERAGAAGQSRNAGTRVVHFGSLRLVCWVPLPPHPTGNLGFFWILQEHGILQQSSGSLGKSVKLCPDISCPFYR